MSHWTEQRRQSAIEHLRCVQWLRAVEWFDSVDSTNLLARRNLLRGTLPLPSLLVADQQTAGRGRSTNSWWSPHGCLMFSLVIGTDLMPPDILSWPQLSLVTGVACALAVETELPGLRAQLKWPNDLYVQNRKLAGILVESITPVNKDSAETAFVVGVGLNVAVPMRDAPQEVRDRACSLNQFSQQPPSLEGMLVRIIEQFETQLNSWRLGEPNWWRQWSDRSLLTGQIAHVRLPNGDEVVGLCEGINANGLLQLRTARQVHHLQSAEILNWRTPTV